MLFLEILDFLWLVIEENAEGYNLPYNLVAYMSLWLTAQSETLQFTQHSKHRKARFLSYDHNTRRPILAQNARFRLEDHTARRLIFSWNTGRPEFHLKVTLLEGLPQPETV
jgi:hypothetical protein